MKPLGTELDPWIERWSLVPDGAPIATASSRLLPVRYRGAPAMLKVATAPEERRGARWMVAWNGEGVARVFEHAPAALVMERATGPRDLVRMATAGGDLDAVRILCRAAARVHAAPVAAPPAAEPLHARFRALRAAAASGAAPYRRAWELAEALLADPVDEGAIHGDLHHGNVLDFGDRGWLAIDPKGVTGERAFDYANLFCNPTPAVAGAPGRVARLAALVADLAGVEGTRLLRWVVAWCGLSAAWHVQEGTDAALALFVAEQAASVLGADRP